MIEEGVLKIPGVGKETLELLLRHFRSTKKIFSANLEELSSIVGEAKAKKILAAGAHMENKKGA